MTSEGKRANEAPLIPSHIVRRVDIKKTETKPSWHIQLQLNQALLKIQSSYCYRLTFQARADGTRQVFLGFARTHDPWTDLGLYRSIALSPEWHSFQEEFVATADNDNAPILFDLGGSTFSAEFTDVKLTRIGDR